MSFFKLMIIVLLISFSGCATFRHGADLAITKWPLDATTNRKTIDIQFKYCNNTEKCPKDIIKANEKAYGPVAKAYDSSGLFTVVKSSGGKTDITLVVNVADNSDTSGEWGKFYAEMCLRSFFMIPLFWKKNTIVESPYLDNTGKIMGSFKTEESRFNWAWWPMILATPFYYPESVKEKIIYDLNRNTIIEAHSKGIF